MVMPPILGDANDYAQAGHNLAGLLMPIKDDWLVSANDFCSQPSPISWLVKWWIQSQALVMVHGPSGCGKTFVVLDWCLRMASGIEEWAGHKVRPSSVVYLAGEGHHGLRGRVAAWKHHNKAGNLSMWLSKDGCDLNTPTGYLKVIEQIRILKNRPSLIVVDTLHRFLLGDESKSEDTKTMLDACSVLIREFDCSVILIHHTGVSDEAQHRARGSSAWRGALDIEISIIPGKDNQPIQIVQRKSKDAELAETMYVELQKVAIPGWMDEDNQQVTSAVIVQAQAPTLAKKDSKIDNHRKTFENAWWSSGAEERNGLPYLSRSAMMDYCIQKLAVSEASAKQYIKPSVPGKPIADLLMSQIIEVFEHGWIIIDEAQASAMLIRKSER
jgi:energy-coupling factor transporter ATP-binding protein EcfA2